MAFIVGILFLANWIFNCLFGTPDDSWVIGGILVMWGWDERIWIWPALKSFCFIKWGHIRHRHIVVLESKEEINDFYVPIYEWIVKNIGKENVWLDFKQPDALHINFNNNKINSVFLISDEPRIYKFRFKRKKDAVAFKLVWR